MIVYPNKRGTEGSYELIFVDMDSGKLTLCLKEIKSQVKLQN